MSLPYTKTLDIASRGLPALYTYPYVEGGLGYNTGLLDIVSRGVPASYIYKPITVLSFGILTSLSKADDDTFAALTSLVFGNLSPFAGQTILEKVNNKSTVAILSTLQQEPTNIKFAVNTVFEKVVHSIPVLTTLEGSHRLLSDIAEDGVTQATSYAYGRGDASGMTYDGEPFVRLTAQAGDSQENASIWVLFNPHLGTHNVVITPSVGATITIPVTVTLHTNQAIFVRYITTGQSTLVLIDKKYNVRQDPNLIVTAKKLGVSSLPGTNGLDRVSRGVPVTYPFNAQTGQTRNTGLLDIASRGMPGSVIYNVPIGSKTASLSILPTSNNNVILDAFNTIGSISSPTPVESSDGVSGTMGGSHYNQVGSPVSKSMEWTLAHGGKYVQAAIAIEKALNNQNTIAWLTSLSEVDLNTFGANAFLSKQLPGVFAVVTTLESTKVHDLGPGIPLGALLALMFSGPNNVAILTILTKSKAITVYSEYKYTPRGTVYTDKYKEGYLDG